MELGKSLYDILHIERRAVVQPPVYRSIGQLLARAADEQSLLNGCQYDTDVYGDNDNDDYPCHELDRFDLIDEANSINERFFNKKKFSKNPSAAEQRPDPDGSPEPTGEDGAAV